MSMPLYDRMQGCLSGTTSFLLSTMLQLCSVLKAGSRVQGQDGVAQINFPNSAKGFRDFILVDDEVQVTVGNRGSVVVIRKR